MRIADRDTLGPAALEVATLLISFGSFTLGATTDRIAGTLTMFLQAVRAQAGIALWQNGEQALANCQTIDRHGSTIRKNRRPHSARSSRASSRR